MGLFDSIKGGNASDRDKMRPSPVREFLGHELYAIDCRGANLYVHENAVVIDKTGGGLWNIGDNNFKVIPEEMQSFFIKAFSSVVSSRPNARDWGQLIHKYISEAGDVKKPEIKPNPSEIPNQPSTSVQPKQKKPRTPSKTTTTQSNVPPTTTQTQETIKNEASNKGNKVLRIVLGIIGMIIGSIGIASSSGPEGLIVFWLIYGVLFAIIYIVRSNKTN